MVQRRVCQHAGRTGNRAGKITEDCRVCEGGGIGYIGNLAGLVFGAVQRTGNVARKITEDCRGCKGGVALYSIKEE